jgi:hypothetical protein
MTTPRVAYTLALIEAAKARIEGMKVENESRLRLGEAPTHSVTEFFSEAYVLQQLAIQVIQG